jgi:hypothetical protein
VARNFDGTDDKLTSTTAVSNLITPSDGTIAVWYRPLGTPANHASNSYGLDPLFADDLGYFGLFRGTIAGTNDSIWAYNWDGNEDRVGGFTYTLDEWVHVTWRHTDGTLYLYKNGTQVNTAPSGSTSQLTGAIRVGVREVVGAYLQGHLAELATWSVALSPEDEISALAKGFSPLMVRPQSLTGYWPLWGQHSPELDIWRGRGLTLSGTEPADHPRIFYPTRPKFIPVPTVGPWHYYNMMGRGQAA